MDPNQPGKSSTTKKWLIGCGIGCGAVIVIAALLITGGVLYVRNLVEGFKDSEAMLEVLTERYGRITEYCPQPDGRIPEERIEAFLGAREAMASVRDEIEHSIRILEDEGEEIDIESTGNVFQKLKLGFGLVPRLANYFKARNQALLDAGMGMGEYYYIYSIVYFAWLDKSLADGPSFPITGEEGDYEFNPEDRNDEEAQEMRQDISLRRLHRMLLPMLRNQYQRLKAEAEPGISQEWAEALAAELEAMEADRYRQAWQDGLPEVIASSLKPYRDRFDASYSRLLNTIEISMEQR
ncbi:MAG: hypothetical protein ACERK6_07375 [Candidatus Aminicenantaceae bacterium]